MGRLMQWLQVCAVCGCGIDGLLWVMAGNERHCSFKVPPQPPLPPPSLPYLLPPSLLLTRPISWYFFFSSPLPHP